MQEQGKSGVSQGSENVKPMNRKVLSHCLLGLNHLRDDEGAGVRYQESKISDQGSMTEKVQAGSRTWEPNLCEKNLKTRFRGKLK